MRKPIPIRIRKSDKEEYRRLVKNTKSKINRTKKNYGIDLSSEINIPNLEEFKTRKDYNEWKKHQKSFTNRSNLKYQFKKNQYDVVASKEQLNRIEKNTKKAQEMAYEKIENAKNKPFISGGKEQGTVEQRMLQMGRPNAGGITIPRDFDFENIRNKYVLEDIERNMIKRSSDDYFNNRNETMKNNFIKILQTTFNSDADELIKKLINIPSDDFYEIYLMFDEFDFDLYSSENDGGMADEGKLHQMELYLEEYENGNIDFDFKKISDMNG